MKQFSGALWYDEVFSLILMEIYFLPKKFVEQIVKLISRYHLILATSLLLLSLDAGSPQKLRSFQIEVSFAENYANFIRRHIVFACLIYYDC